MVLTGFGSTKSAIVGTTNRSVNLSLNLGLLLQQLIALMKGDSANFWNVYYTILKEMRGHKIFNLPR